jgi:hypothetical protein
MNQFQIMKERQQLKNLQYWLTRAPMSGILLLDGAFFKWVSLRWPFVLLRLVFLCISSGPSFI